MKNLPIATRFIINFLLFLIYSLVGMLIGGFIFGWILDLMGKTIPVNSDPIYMKLAWFIVLIVLIKTLILRKYFYISTNIENDDKILINNDKKVKEMEILLDKEIKKGD